MALGSLKFCPSCRSSDSLSDNCSQNVSRKKRAILDPEKEPLSPPHASRAYSNGGRQVSLPSQVPTYFVPGLPFIPTAGGNSAGGATSENGLTLKEYLLLLRRRRTIVLYAFTFVTVIGTIWTLLQPPVYRAAGKLMIAPQGSVVNAVDAANPLSGLFTPRVNQNTDTQVEALQSIPLLEATRKKLGEGAEFALKVEVVGRTNVIKISAESNRPKIATAAPMVLMKAYLEMGRKDNLDELSQARDFVEKQRRVAASALITSENALRQFKQQSRVTELEKSRDSHMGRVDALQTRLGELRSREKISVAQIQSVQNQLKAEPEAIATNLASDNVVRGVIREELRKLQVERTGQAQRFGPKNRTLIAIDAQILKLQEQLLQQPDLLTTRTSTPNQIRADLRAKLATLLSDSVAAATESRQVSDELAAARSELSRYPDYEMTLARLMRRHEAAGENEKMLSAKAVDLALREKAYRPGAHIMETPGLPTAPVRPRKLQNIFVFALFGLFLGVCLALIQEYLDDRINSQEESDRVLHLTSLGMIPAMTDADARLLPLAQLANPALESYRLLRTNIQFASIDDPVRTLLVTSSSPGEGKSTTAVNLAFAMALDGKRVILVDTDLRRPSMHRRLQVPKQPGLTDVLLGNASLEDVMTPQEDVPNLSIITAGAQPPNPSELLNSRKFQALCTQLTDWADIVIFDSPPLLVAADGVILASQMDSTILVIEAGGTRKSDACAAVSALEQARARVLGVVHNKLKSSLREGYDFYAYSPYRYQYGATPKDGDISRTRRNGERGRSLLAELTTGVSKLSSGARREHETHDRDA